MQKSIKSKVAKDIARAAKTILKTKYGSCVKFGQDGEVYLDSEYIGNLDACNQVHALNAVEFASRGGKHRVI